MPSNDATSDASQAAPRQYVVVARRYRPQTFSELIGQEHVGQALSNAIATNRVGHAYLFTGARGVGKTSAARILAKALNCVDGPTPTPCNRCDICQSISTGEDVDVLEIDGASNRGIDEIRQLRQNAGVRPSRSRFKIYIIDEVHMLTREAFNALLKTLEEPPEHVKFIFCTTEPTKIPITILSRCQRFDFAGILTRSIHERLAQIVEAEGVEAEPEALEVLARRAAGSMRDSQSLLEQLLAFASGKITVADVHGMLGAAGEERLASLIGHLLERNAAAALADLDAAMLVGVDAGQLIEQLFGSLRDCMVAAVGCPSEAFLYTSPSGGETIVAAGKRWGLNTLLAIMQILDQTLSRMRYSTQGRILAELALVRIAQLDDFDDLAELIGRLQSGVQPPAQAAPQSPVVKKKYEPPVAHASSLSTALPGAAAGLSSSVVAEQEDCDEEPTGQANLGEAGPSEVKRPDEVASGSRVELSPQNAIAVWNRAIERVPGLVAEQARLFDSVSVAANSVPVRLVIWFKRGYAFAKDLCERPEHVARFEQALAEVAGQVVRVSFSLREENADDAEPAARAVPAHQRLMEAAKHPFVRRAGELFGAQPTHVD